MTTIFSIVPNTLNGTYTGYTGRQVIPLANLINPGFNSGWVRVTFGFDSSAVAANIDVAWIGGWNSASSYGYDGSQVQLFFRGLANSNGSTGAVNVVSDWAPFSFNFGTGGGLLVAVHFSGTSAFVIALSSDPSCVQYYQVEAAGSEGQTSPTGSFTTSGLAVSYVRTIEFISTAAPFAQGPKHIGWF
jgi:hypothetical protein